MVPHSMMFRAASALTVAGIVLVLANWYAKPESALAFAAELAMFAVMGAALRASHRAVRTSCGTANQKAVAGIQSIPTAVVFAALMLGIPLALTLARPYGLLDRTDIDRRSTGVLIGVFLAMSGNVMPKNLPPLSSTGIDGARQQAFHRRMGWTWALCGLASAIAWLALPIDSAEMSTFVVWPTALVVSGVHLLRLQRPRKDEPAHGLNGS